MCTQCSHTIIYAPIKCRSPPAPWAALGYDHTAVEIVTLHGSVIYVPHTPQAPLCVCVCVCVCVCACVCVCVCVYVCVHVHVNVYTCVV